jgi:hypothetical protein
VVGRLKKPTPLHLAMCRLLNSALSTSICSFHGSCLFLSVPVLMLLILIDLGASKIPQRSSPQVILQIQRHETYRLPFSDHTLRALNPIQCSSPLQSFAPSDEPPCSWIYKARQHPMKTAATFRGSYGLSSLALPPSKPLPLNMYTSLLEQGARINFSHSAGGFPFCSISTKLSLDHGPSRPGQTLSLSCARHHLPVD